MPRFDFKCSNGHVWEAVIALHDVKTPKCPTCRRKGEKQPAAPNFAIKGYSAKNGYSRKD